MRDVETTLAEMREFLPVASKDDEQRVRDLTERDIKRTLRDVRIPDVVIGRVLAQWPEFRADDEWVSLLASLVAWVDQCRVTSMSRSRSGTTSTTPARVAESSTSISSRSVTTSRAGSCPTVDARRTSSIQR